MQAALIALSACSSMPPPAQPTPISIQDTIVSLGQITADPQTTWDTGNYAVRAACYAYLNQSASKSSNLSLANTGVGMVSSTAAGFLSVADPLAGAVAGAAGALIQGFLSAYQASGAMPSGATSTLILSALNAEEDGVSHIPPTSNAKALGYVIDLWWQCTPGGYEQLVLRSAMGADVSVSTLAEPAASEAIVRQIVQHGSGAASRHRAASTYHATVTLPDDEMQKEWATVQSLGRTEAERRLARPRVLVNGR